MGGSTITNKPKPNKLQVGSGGDKHLSNNVNSSVARSPPCANQYIPSDAPPVDAQSNKKTLQMDSKYPKLPLRIERTGVHSYERGIGHPVNL